MIYLKILKVEIEKLKNKQATKDDLSKSKKSPEKKKKNLLSKISAKNNKKKRH